MAFGEIALNAGRMILTTRHASMPVSCKADGSPVTQADVAADCLIRSQLPDILPGVPIVSEECVAHDDRTRNLDRFILVDPLDGTREFAAGRNEYTVNIALVENGVPVAGAIYAPALGRLYVAGDQAFSAEVTAADRLPKRSAMQLLKARKASQDGLRATVSRSHLDPSTKEWLERRAINRTHAAGSSLKFCAIAEGQADVYPRLGTTMEWDTAAGQAILTAAGGCVVQLDGTPLRYGKHDAGLRNPSFVAWGEVQHHMESLVT